MNYVYFSIIIIILVFYNLCYKSNFKDTFESKPKAILCLFGVIPRSIKHTWSSINNKIVKKLQTEYDVEIFI